MGKDLTKVSKYISLILRHKPEEAGITLDKHGWASVDDLVKGVREHYDGTFTKHLLVEIVRTDDKQRYSFDEYYKKIRANQGHSVPIDLELTATTPPDKLYHGTGKRAAGLIMGDGIRKQSRQYVHLSEKMSTAQTVGLRHDTTCVIFEIDAKQMHSDGYEFFISENGVWLTDFVPARYLTIVYDTDELNRMLKSL